MDLTVLLGKKMPHGKPGKPEPDEEGPDRLIAASRALLDAIADDDEQGVADALRTAFALCANEEDAEPEKGASSIYDEE